MQIGEKFSTLSTVKTVESAVKSVEWLINFRRFSTFQLKFHLKPLVQQINNVENNVKAVENTISL